VEEPGRVFERPAQMLRLAIPLCAALVAAACGVGPSPTATPESPPPSSPTAGGSTAGGLSPDVAAFGGALQAGGAAVTELGTFNPDPLGGRGIHLCVAREQVNVYVYGSEQERQAVADRIDPDDPGNVGTAMVSWVGNPRFWQRDRLIVLYLGKDPAVEAGISAVLGEPFARGQGRGPVGPDQPAC